MSDAGTQTPIRHPQSVWLRLCMALIVFAILCFMSYALGVQQPFVTFFEGQEEGTLWRVPWDSLGETVGEEQRKHFAPVLFALTVAVLFYIWGYKWVPIFHRSGKLRGLPPSRFVADTIGLLQFAVRSRQQRALREDEDVDGPGPVVPESAEFKPLRPELPSAGQVAAKYYTIITGPPGVGKTTYLRAVRDHIKTDFALVAELSPMDLTDAVEADNPAMIWHMIVRSVSHAGPHPAELAFVLGRRRVLMTVDDLHTVPRRAADVLCFIARYFQVYHRWTPNVSVICATRESERGIDQNVANYARLIPLRPLGKIEARELFWNLCLKNGIKNRELLQHHDILAKAFATEALQVPLFVGLSAWIASPKAPRPVEVARVLAMTATDLLEQFLRELYLRATSKVGGAEPADPSAAEVTRFRRLLDALAYEFWPSWQRLDEYDVAQRLNEGADDPALGLPRLDLRFLKDNGFLVKDQVIGFVRFPHEAVADYLAAVEMVRGKNYSVLALCRNAERHRGVGAMLAELIEEREAFERLIHDHLPTALHVLREPRFSLVLDDLDFGFVGRWAARWASSGAPHPVAPADWREWDRLVAHGGSRPWLKSFLFELRENARPSAEGVMALVAIEAPEARALLREWLTNPAAAEAFKSAADRIEVQEELLEVIREGKLSSRLARRALDVLWRRRAQAKRESDQTDLLEEWLQRLVRLGCQDELAVLVKTYKRPMIARLAQIAATESEACKRLLSEVCADVFSEALVSPGKYQVADAHGLRDVQIPMPFLVPCLAKELGCFNRVGDAQAALARDASKLMYWDEARVVARYFEHRAIGRRNGVLFKDEPNTYEAARETAARVWFFKVPPSGRRDVAPGRRDVALQNSSLWGKRESFNVVFRPIERLRSNQRARSTP